jgi:hypothetical protein
VGLLRRRFDTAARREIATGAPGALDRTTTSPPLEEQTCGRSAPDTVLRDHLTDDTQRDDSYRRPPHKTTSNEPCPRRTRKMRRTRKKNEEEERRRIFPFRCLEPSFSSSSNRTSCSSVSSKLPIVTFSFQTPRPTLFPFAKLTVPFSKNVDRHFPLSWSIAFIHFLRPDSSFHVQRCSGIRS